LPKLIRGLFAKSNILSSRELNITELVKEQNNDNGSFIANDARREGERAL